jgi:SAM-dependent methyltransferase/uncharacterized protein YqgC (DUF456 family)
MHVLGSPWPSTFDYRRDVEIIQPPARLERRLLVWLFIVMSATFLVLQQGVVTGYDGGTMYEVTKSMVERESLSVSGEWNTLPGRDGLDYSRYGLGLSLLSIIPYVLARPLAELTGHPDFVLSAAVSSIMPLIAAALALALYGLARRMGAGLIASVMVGVGIVIGTFMLPYGKEFFSEPLAALCLVVAIERSLAKRSATSGLAMGIAVLTRPQTLLFAPILILVAWRRNGGRAALYTMAGLVPGVVATFAYNVARFGGPFRFGYQDVGFTTPFLTGARGLLLEPTKSILLFAPVVLLLPFALQTLWRRDRWAFVLITANLTITFIVTATWFSWHGGWSWGPRLLLPGVIPALAALGPWSSTPMRRRTTALLLAIGFAVSFPALIVAPEAQLLEVTTPPPETHFLDTQPLSSPSVTRQAELIPAAIRYSVEHPYEDRRDGLNRLRTLSLWQLGAMRALGRPGLVASMAGTALLLIVVVVGGRKLLLVFRDIAGSDPAGPAETELRADAYPGVSNLEAMQAAPNYNAFLTSVLLTRVDVSRPVLDFGAGTGTHASQLRERGVIVRCVEPDPQLRRRLKQEGFVVAGDVLEYGAGSFTSIYSLNVLEHIPDDDEVLRQLFAATEPGGRLILYVPAFQILFSAMDRRVGHIRRYRKGQLHERVRRAGFRVISCRYVDSLGFLAALAYRSLARSGELDTKSVARYDRFVFPVSRALDRVTARWIGKNLLVEARRD